MIPRDYDFPPKPIEDKEHTAFQWDDKLVKEYAMSWYSEGTPIDQFKKSKLSQSIPAGTGTANETINEERLRFTKPKEHYDGGKYKPYLQDEVGQWPSATFPNNPILERNDKKYTEADLKKAFDNAHLMKGDRYVYNTFEDYKNSLK